jgi:hypothetical protein
MFCCELLGQDASRWLIERVLVLPSLPAWPELSVGLALAPA